MCVSFFFYLDGHFIICTHKPKIYSNPPTFEKNKLLTISLCVRYRSNYYFRVLIIIIFFLMNKITINIYHHVNEFRNSGTVVIITQQLYITFKTCANITFWMLKKKNFKKKILEEIQNYFIVQCIFILTERVLFMFTTTSVTSIQ